MMPGTRLRALCAMITAACTLGISALPAQSLPGPRLGLSSSQRIEPIAKTNFSTLVIRTDSTGKHSGAKPAAIIGAIVGGLLGLVIARGGGSSDAAIIVLGAGVGGFVGYFLGY